MLPIHACSEYLIGQVLINAPTFAPEPGVGIHGLGWVYLNELLDSSDRFCRGSTGYGRFDLENFTQRRAVVITPPGLELPLVSDL
jgi:hypothetical protein